MTIEKIASKSKALRALEKLRTAIPRMGELHKKELRRRTMMAGGAAGAAGAGIGYVGGSRSKKKMEKKAMLIEKIAQRVPTPKHILGLIGRTIKPKHGTRAKAYQRLKKSSKRVGKKITTDVDKDLLSNLAVGGAIGGGGVLSGYALGRYHGKKEKKVKMKKGGMVY